MNERRQNETPRAGRPFLPYPAYKPSGVEWLGEIPEDWGVKRIKSVVRRDPGSIRTGPFGSQLLSAEMEGTDYKVYTQQNVIRADEGSGDLYVSKDKFLELKEFEVFPEDVLITTRGTIGRCLILSENAERGILHPCLMRIRPDDSVINPQFLLRFIQDSDIFREQLLMLSNATTIDVVYSPTVKDLVIPLPLLEEQRAIAAFLDRQTAKIDELVAKKERLVELLEEKKTALISRAVTRGLDADAPLKPSGVEWLGEIPAHWEPVLLKRTGVMSYGDSLPGDSRHEGIVKVFGSNGIVGVHDVANTKSPVIIIGRKGSYGKLNYSEESCFAIDTTYFIDFTKTTANLRWLFYVLTCLRLDEFTEDSAVPGLSREYVYNRNIPLPKEAEQRAIAAFLDRETAKIDALVAKVREGVEKLKEYRTALISAAVTGKIDVRGG